MNACRIFVRFEAGDAMRKIRGVESASIIAFVDSLRDNPGCIGDYGEIDESDREVQIKVIGRFEITYWADHPVGEVKVVDIRRADRV